MRIIHRYIVTDFLVILILSLLIFTFVTCVGSFIKAIDFIAKGVSVGFVFKYLLYNMPYVLMYSIPMATLTAVLLLFGRLSIDGEITALKASGMSMWQIISPVIMISLILSFICVYINSALAPRSHYARRTVEKSAGVQDMLGLLEPGRYIDDFPNQLIRIGKKKGNRMEDIKAYHLESDGRVKQILRAQSGEYYPTENPDIIEIILYEVRIETPDEAFPLDPAKSKYRKFKEYPERLDFSEKNRVKKPTKKVSDMTLMELVHAIRNIREKFSGLNVKDLLEMRMTMIVEANERLALSLSCFAFTLLGIPLGMKSRRRESSIGIGISLVLVFIFYLFVGAAQSLVSHPAWRPDLIIWIPVVAAEIAGFYLINRLN